MIYIISENLEIHPFLKHYNKTLQHPYGHIQAYNGKQWLSDYKQDYFIPYKSQLTILRGENKL